MPALQHQPAAQHVGNASGGPPKRPCVDLTVDSDCDMTTDSDCMIVQRNPIDLCDSDSDCDAAPKAPGGSEHNLLPSTALQHGGPQCRQLLGTAVPSGSPQPAAAVTAQMQPQKNETAPAGHDPADSRPQPLKQQQQLNGSSSQGQQQQQQQQQQPSMPSSRVQSVLRPTLSRQQRLALTLSQSPASSSGTNGVVDNAAGNARGPAGAAQAALGSNLQAAAEAAAESAAAGRDAQQAPSHMVSAPMVPVAAHVLPDSRQPNAAAATRPKNPALPAIKVLVQAEAPQPVARPPAQPEPQQQQQVQQDSKAEGWQQPAAKVLKTSPIWSDSRKSAAQLAHAMEQLQQLSSDGSAGISAGGNAGASTAPTADGAADSTMYQLPTDQPPVAMPTTPATQEQAGVAAFSPDQPLQGLPSLQPAQAQRAALGDGVKLLHGAQLAAQPAAGSSPAATSGGSDLFALPTAPDKARAKFKPLLSRPRKGDQHAHSGGAAPAAIRPMPRLEPSVTTQSAPPSAATVPHPDSRTSKPAAAAAAAEAPAQPTLFRKSSSKEVKLSCMLREAEAAQAAAGSRRRGAAVQAEAQLAARASAKQTAWPPAAIPSAPRSRSVRKSSGKAAPRVTAAAPPGCSGAAAGGEAGSQQGHVHRGDSKAAQQPRQTQTSVVAVHDDSAAPACKPAAASVQATAAADKAVSGANLLGFPWTPQLVAAYYRSKHRVSQEMGGEALSANGAKRTDAPFKELRAQRILQHMGGPPGLSVQKVRVAERLLRHNSSAARGSDDATEVRPQAAPPAADMTAAGPAAICQPAAAAAAGAPQTAPVSTASPAAPEQGTARPAALQQGEAGMSAGPATAAELGAEPAADSAPDADAPDAALGLGQPRPLPDIPPCALDLPREHVVDPEEVEHVQGVLEVYWKRYRVLQSQGQSKPDMKANSELKHLRPPRRHGHVPGIAVGREFANRGEIAIVGIHTQIMRGIDSRKGEPAYAICNAGGYEGNVDTGADFIYSGEGKGDQSMHSKDNAALQLSWQQGMPVRVVRKKGTSLWQVYEGLYRVVDAWQEPQGDFLICKFRMIAIPGHSKVSITVQNRRITAGHLRTRQVLAAAGSEPFGRRAAATAADERRRAAARAAVEEPGRLVCKDISGGLERRPIPVYNDVDDEESPTDAQGLTYIRDLEVRPGSRAPEFLARGAAALEAAFAAGRRRCGVAHTARDNAAGPDPNYTGSRLCHTDPCGIYECPASCCMDPACLNNRVVTNGVAAQLEVFKTRQCGWGLRCRKDLKNGEFVCAYVGEIITDEEAEWVPNDQYLMNLDHFAVLADEAAKEVEQGKVPDWGPELMPPLPYGARDSEAGEDNHPTICAIDASRRGNVARFINHSCAPNLLKQVVLTEGDHGLKHRVAFFATEHILAGEELRYDYCWASRELADKQMACNCGEANCCMNMFGNLAKGGAAQPGEQPVAVVAA